MAIFHDASNRAGKVRDMILERARDACEQAGLSRDLLGIHPHNAMVSFNAGEPWRGVDYSKVRLSLRLQRMAWEPSRVLEQWSRKQPRELWPEMYGWSK